MPRRLRLSDEANDDVDGIWHYTVTMYGFEQASNYIVLLRQAFLDIEENPERPSSRRHPELGPRVRSYRIELSKDRSGTGIKTARHIVFYTLQHEDLVLVVRILHDQMDPLKHLPGG